MTLFDLHEYGRHLQTSVDAIRGLEFVSEYVEIEDRTKNLKPAELPVLVIVEPSIKFKGPNEDNLRKEFPCLFFVLEKRDKASLRPGDLLAAKDRMRNLALDVAGRMRADKDAHGGPAHLMCELDLGSIVIDPEDDVAGLAGYSLAFTLRKQWK
jgi:hypothetical protein